MHEWVPLDSCSKGVSGADGPLLVQSWGEGIRVVTVVMINTQSSNALSPSVPKTKLF